MFGEQILDYPYEKECIGAASVTLYSEFSRCSLSICSGKP